MSLACLIIDEMHESIVPLLEDLNFEVNYRPDIKREEIINMVAQYDGLVVRSKTTIDREILDKAPKLKFIARAGAGVDKIDLEAVSERNIHLINAPEGNRDAVAEHAVGMLLCLMNHICMGDQQIRQGIWNREANRGYEIMGKTVAVIGYGNMGSAFAHRLSGFGCKVIAYDKNVSGFGDTLVHEASMEQVYEQADIVSFHIPLDQENRWLVDKHYLEKFRKEIFLINTARGGILKLSDLAEMIKAGKVKGAALDVLENEKLHTHSPEQAETLEALKNSGKVLFTPHVAGWTFESYEKLNQVLAGKLEKILPSLI